MGGGIFIFDRGGDRKRLYDELLGDPLRRFIVRQRGDRHLLYRGTPCETLSLAQSCPTPFAETVIKEEDGTEKAYFLHFGFRPVRLPAHPKRKLWLVVWMNYGPLQKKESSFRRRLRKRVWPPLDLGIPRS